MLRKQPNDKRETARLSLDSNVSISADQQHEIVGKLQNLSATGLSVKTDTRMNTGTSCNLSITIEGDNSNLKINKLSAKVIRFDDDVVAFEFNDKMEWLTLFYIYKGKFDLEKV